MRLMGIQAVYPKKKTIIINKKEYKYPYILSDIKIIKSSQVWSTDITYIKILGGFVYLAALID
jgi:putative transposase